MGANLQQLLDQITQIQSRGSELVDPAGSMQMAQTALLAQLVAEVTALQSATPVAASAGLTQEQVQEMVAEAVSAAFGKLESAAGSPAAEAQPAVAQNTGSGAAPVDPSPATGSASPTPDAAGTAHQTPQA